MRYMKSVTFTCTMSAEEIEKTLRARNLTYTLMTWMCPLSVLLFGFVYYQSVSRMGVSFDPVLALILGAGALMMMVFFFVFRKVQAKQPAKYELMPTKEFAWDEATSQFIYKDKNGTIRFRGDDLEIWHSFVNNRSQIPTDIFTLRTGEKIILEGEWNPELHNYLNNFRNLLGLPEPKRMIWTLDVY
jgi:hypothetical protein